VTSRLGALAGRMAKSLRPPHMAGSLGGRSFESATVWSAPADTSLPGRSFFAILKGSDVSEGERLLAWAPVGAAEPGVLIPYAAVLINGGKYWCYVEEKPGLFVRQEVGPGMA